MIDRDPELQRLLDESAIRNVLDKYPRALDRQDPELLASLFHPGAQDDHGFFNGPIEGYVEWIRKGSFPGSHWMHHNGTQIVEVDGDVAQAETYALAFFRKPAVEGQPTKEIFLRVRYLDRLERRDNAWKIAHRRVVYSPCHVLPIAEEFPLTADCLVEGTPQTDPVYRW